MCSRTAPLDHFTSRRCPRSSPAPPWPACRCSRCSPGWTRWGSPPDPCSTWWRPWRSRARRLVNELLTTRLEIMTTKASQPGPRINWLIIHPSPYNGLNLPTVSCSRCPRPGDTRLRWRLTCEVANFKVISSPSFLGVKRFLLNTKWLKVDGRGESWLLWCGQAPRLGCCVFSFENTHRGRGSG